MLKLNNGYQIESDGTQYIVKQIQNKFSEKKNEEVESVKIIGYCVTFQNAIDLYIESGLKSKIEKEDVCFKDLVELLKDSKKLISEFKKELHERCDE